MVLNIFVVFWVSLNHFTLPCDSNICVVSLPELIAQTNMDQQSVNRLREELLKVTNFLGKNFQKYFASEYHTPSQPYIDQARSG